MILTSKGFEPMFERKTDENFKTNIEITSKFVRSDAKDRKLAEDRFDMACRLAIAENIINFSVASAIRCKQMDYVLTSY